MDLYSLFMPDHPGPDRPPRGGLFRFLRTFWDNLGKLLAVNLACFLGFLPLALLVSLGLVYESFWLALAGGMLGGAAAGPFWTAALSLALLCLRGSPYRWFPFWKKALAQSWKCSALQGAAIGGAFAAVLFAGSFFLRLMGEGELPAFPVWLFLAVDCLVPALAATLLFPPLCMGERPFPRRAREGLALLVHSPARALGAALALLAWILLGVGLFPVSVPFAAVIGFWPAALLQAQFLEPALDSQLGLGGAFDRMELEADTKTLSRSQRMEIWLRRFWAPALGGLAAVSLLLGFLQVRLNTREPDIQLAVVHGSALPDRVLSALESSLAGLAGDRNGDGTAVALVNDYVLSFDGAVAGSADMQAAGVTRLVTDLSGEDSVLFIVEDEAGFRGWYGDQVNGAEGRRWADCPPLAALDAGLYSTVEDISADLSGQELLAGYTVFPALHCPEELLDLLMGR